MSLRAKCLFSFGVVLALLGVISIWSITGMNGITSNAEVVITGNILRSMAAQREIDHLNWVAKLSALLTDNSVTSLNLETDDHKCGFGKWLYGQGRQDAVQLVPSLRGLLKEIEEPHAQLHVSAIEINKVFKQADPDLPALIANRKVDHLKWASGLRDTFLLNKKEVTVQTDPTKCALGRFIDSGAGNNAYQQGSANFQKAWDEMVADHRKLHNSAQEVKTSYRQINEGLEQMLYERLLDHKNWSEKVAQAIILGKSDLGVQIDPAKCGYGIFLAGSEYQELAATFPEVIVLLESSKKYHNELHETAIDINAALKKGAISQAKKIYQQQTLPALAGVSAVLKKAITQEEALRQTREYAEKIFSEIIMPALSNTLKALDVLEIEAKHELQGMQEANKIFADKTKRALHKVQELMSEIKSTIDKNIMTDEVMVQSANSTKSHIMLVSVIALLFGVFLALIMVRSITKPINFAVNGLSSEAEQVSSAAGQVSASSQSLADGASSQAAALEETSSTMEEMSSMTARNAANSQEADNLMKSTLIIIKNADTSMSEMNASMDEITTASEETSKIVKTIDEIAFQTNLLALNAAVEAARAGEAGAGFAVVADEVRNLAMRAADAARNTSELIEGTVQKVHAGKEIVLKAIDAFHDVADNSAKIGTLVGEITSASKEQAHGFSQVTSTISQMDNVTQQNAAIAEQSAAASKQLNGQAASMTEMITGLKYVVHGGGKGLPAREQGVVKKLCSTQAKSTPPVPLTIRKPNRIEDPEQLIPMDSDRWF